LQRVNPLLAFSKLYGAAYWNSKLPDLALKIEKLRPILIPFVRRNTEKINLTALAGHLVFFVA
jgi:hypothetical protein